MTIKSSEPWYYSSLPRTADRDPEFNKLMNVIWEGYIKSDPDGKMDPVFDLDLKAYDEHNVFIINLFDILKRLPPAQQKRICADIITLATKIAGPQGALTRLTRGAIKFSDRAGYLAHVTIVSVLLSWEALQSISLWWKGEISGQRCAKNIIDAASTVAGGVGGGALGSTIGTVISPGVGTFIGGLIGGMIGSNAVATLSKWLTEHLFDLPPTVALENAYNFLGLTASCTNSDINTAYRKLVLLYHPDKGGPPEYFYKLQYYVAIIKQARGEGL
ncbi:unnamed protein product [Didymodactylos carnosus]|uniref:J domain-containing protein n=1 Tax=Didymodactylos carnosus TaxID=1234261 RepID=A0A815VPA5_9BILA|nr:unnamed protein product [Didymodactylos carnosus]CAF4390720.1 unnamed protein product [Didymodactylos carnosus]